MPKVLIHGARLVLCHAKKMKGLRAWALRLEKIAGHNKAAAALANKMGWIVWAVWKRYRHFEPIAQSA